MKTDNNLGRLSFYVGRKKALIRTRNEIVDTLHAIRYLDQWIYPHLLESTAVQQRER